MLKTGQGLVGDREQRLDAQSGIVADPHQVTPIATRTVDGPVLPGLDQIADELLRPPRPGNGTKSLSGLLPDVFVLEDRHDGQ